MTEFDRILADLTTDVERLPPRPTVALFAACGSGLQPAFLEWAARRHAGTEGLLDHALSVAFAYARDGVAEVDLRALLRSLEEATPPGESANAHPSTVAQDCWICADTAIRALVDPAFAPAPVIAYALEPIIQATTENLFGVSDVGSGDEEADRVATVFANPRVAAAVDFVRWATEQLARDERPNDELIAQLQMRSAVLKP